ncbi:MAG: ABC-F family ATP-binding cassette domain-containing protein [Eubacterium aggregans]|uniref:ribosomal protection-like ABC-F family protein n=1 Tax=Eubacterium aggregans TaxID=81409 RepID=UPI002B204056|nr:ABC-F family ATP-binding cassette domain-containing protein [Eubacterium aggregans]MEA5073115.1 ABC-F family ATP-binding cassette domain-containing protein [Eubacterium aggregans]
MLININQLSFSYGVHSIFNNLDFRIDDTEHLGLIGRNGCGKSTFFKLLTSECHRDTGTLDKKNGLTLGLLSQEFKASEHETVGAIFTAVFQDLIEMEGQIQSLQQRIDTAEATEQQRLVHQLAELQEQYADRGGFEYHSRIRGVTIGLGFQLEDLEKAFGKFSGGEKTRIALGCLLLQSPDLLLLDEPTNYLDFEALNWLESFLNNYKNAFIIVSHDRFFLDRVCTRICEIEDHGMVSYTGNYTQYLDKKEKRDRAMDAAYDKQMKELTRQQKIVDRLRDYNSVQSSRRAASREKAIERIKPVERRQDRRSLHFSFSPKVISGNDVLMVEELEKSFGDRQLFKDVSFEIHRGDRIGIIGRNGIGKTTLFQILMKQIKPDSGRVVFGRKVYPGYYAQEPDEALLAPNETLIDAIRDIDSHLTDGDIRNILASFLFTGETVFKHSGDLSGGEKARLNMARLMVSESNFLLMDEPTNHIDMSTREILEDALCGYEGTLLFISHDRYFLNRVANRIFELTPGGIEETIGNYDDYARTKQNQSDRESLLAQSHAPQTNKTRRKQERQQAKALEAERRRHKKALAQLEEQMESNDERIAAYEADMCQPSFYDDMVYAQKITDDYHALKADNENIIQQWEDLALQLEED